MVKHQQINKAGSSGSHGIDASSSIAATTAILVWVLVQSSLSITALRLFSSACLVAQAWSKNRHAKTSTVAIFYVGIIMIMHTLKSNPFTAVLILSFIDLIQRELLLYASAKNSLALSVTANMLYSAMIAVVYLDCC